MSNSRDTEKSEDIVLPYLSWTSRDVADIQDMWDSMIGGPTKELKGIGISLTIWMFDNLPGLKNRFKMFCQKSEKELVMDSKFVKHSERVVTDLDELIRDLNDPKKFQEDLRNNASAHLFFNPPVVSKDFEEFRDKFYLFVNQCRKRKCNSRERNLWYQFNNAIVRACKDEEDVWQGHSSEALSTASAHLKKPGSGNARPSYFVNQVGTEENTCCPCSIL